MAKHIDPVCKMDVDEENPPGGKAEYEGKTYYFCAPGCKVMFQRDPEKYKDKDTRDESQGSGSMSHD